MLPSSGGNPARWGARELPGRGGWNLSSLPGQIRESGAPIPAHLPTPSGGHLPQATGLPCKTGVMEPSPWGLPRESWGATGPCRERSSECPCLGLAVPCLMQPVAAFQRPGSQARLGGSPANWHLIFASRQGMAVCHLAVLSPSVSERGHGPGRLWQWGMGGADFLCPVSAGGRVDPAVPPGIWLWGCAGAERRSKVCPWAGGGQTSARGSAQRGDLPVGSPAPPSSAPLQLLGPVPSLHLILCPRPHGGGPPAASQILWPRASAPEIREEGQTGS